MANATKTVIIAEKKSNDKFVNIKDNTGTEYGISREKSPKLSEEADKLNIGDEITGEYFMWKEKHYLSEIKSGSAKGNEKSFTPPDKSFDAAKTSALAVASMFSLEKDKSTEKVSEMFEALHKLIMSKVTK